MKLRYLAAALVSVALAAGCDNDPGKDKVKARVSAPVEAQSITTDAATKLAFSSTDGSTFAFVGAKVTGKQDGSFGKFSGIVDLVDGNPEKSKVDVEVDIGSLSTDAEMLTEHLKSPDFFDAAKFPTAHFTSTAIRGGGEKGATHTITGNLQLHGVTKSISFPATIKVSGDQVDADAEFTINRNDFGVAYSGKQDDLIKDEVLLKLAIRAKAKKAV